MDRSLVAGAQKPLAEELFRILSDQSRSDCRQAIFLVETIELSGNSAISLLEMSRCEIRRSGVVAEITTTKLSSLGEQKAFKNG
jgi:hypothetical protein